jgi:hypothetical protein
MDGERKVSASGESAAPQAPSPQVTQPQARPNERSNVFYAVVVVVSFITSCLLCVGSSYLLEWLGSLLYE